MFKNIGGKIKGLAIAIFIVGLVLYGIGGLIMLVSGFIMLANGLGAGAAMIFAAILTFGIGFLASWLSVLVLYGFGELVAKVCNIEKAVCNKAGENLTAESTEYLYQNYQYQPDNNVPMV